MCHVIFKFTGDGGTEGAGVNAIYLKPPYLPLASGYSNYIIKTGNAYLSNAGATARQTEVAVTVDGTDGAYFYYQSTIVTAIVGVTCAMQDNASRTLEGQFKYNAFHIQGV